MNTIYPDHTPSKSYRIQDGGWFVQVKELEGCMSQADTWDEILPMIEEAKQLWIEVSLEHGHPIPEPIGIPG